MDDAALVRGFQRVGHLAPDGNRLGNRQAGHTRPPGSCEAIGQGLAFDQLHHQRLQPAAFFDPVQRRDVGMVHRRQRSRLVLQASEAPGVETMLLRQQLQRHITLEPGVPAR